jgi:hypothetical protein
MNETIVKAVVESLFELAKKKEVGHPLVVKIIDHIEQVTLEEIPAIEALVKGKLGL